MEMAIPTQLILLLQEPVRGTMTVFCRARMDSFPDWPSLSAFGSGDFLMSDADQQGTGDSGVPVSRYDVVPSAAKSNDADLYSFRAEIPPPPMPVAPRPM